MTFHEWCETEDGLRCLNATSLHLSKEGQGFFKNRLWCAFNAGAKSQEDGSVIAIDGGQIESRLPIVTLEFPMPPVKPPKDSATK